MIQCTPKPAAVSDAFWATNRLATATVLQQHSVAKHRFASCRRDPSRDSLAVDPTEHVMDASQLKLRADQALPHACDLPDTPPRAAVPSDAPGRLLTDFQNPRASSRRCRRDGLPSRHASAGGRTMTPGARGQAVRIPGRGPQRHRHRHRLAGHSRRPSVGTSSPPPARPSSRSRSARWTPSRAQRIEKDALIFLHSAQISVRKKEILEPSLVVVAIVLTSVPAATQDGGGAPWPRVSKSGAGRRLVPVESHVLGRPNWYSPLGALATDRCRPPPRGARTRCASLRLRLRGHSNSLRQQGSG